MAEDQRTDRWKTVHYSFGLSFVEKIEGYTKGQLKTHFFKLTRQLNTFHSNTDKKEAGYGAKLTLPASISNFVKV